MCRPPNSSSLARWDDAKAKTAIPAEPEPYSPEPYLGHKKRADSSGRENTFVADKVRELDDSAADSRPDLPCKLDGKLDGKSDGKRRSRSFGS